MESIAVRIPRPLYEHIKQRAIGERRSTTQQTALLLETALAHESLPPEPWPGEIEQSVLDTPGSVMEDMNRESAAEVEPEPEPEWVAPTEVPPYVRADEVTPDWKGGKK